MSLTPFGGVSKPVAAAFEEEGEQLLRFLVPGARGRSIEGIR